MQTLLRALVLAALAAAVAPATAGAAVFTVDSTADLPDFSGADDACSTTLGACTLRAAVQQANASVGADDIVVPAGTYNLGSTVTITTTVNITGPAGARATVIDGAPSAVVITVNGGGTMTYSGITLTGGAIGTEIQNADVTLDGVSVRGNQQTSAGLVEGGGIRLLSGSLTLRRSTVSGNTITSTGAQAIGGGIALGMNTTLVAERTTITGNRAEASATPFGGGISIRSGAKATLRHVTIAGNTATGGSSAQGTNVYRDAASGLVTIENSIIADGSGAGGANCSAAGAGTALGRNLDTGTSCGFGAGHLNATPAQLGALADAGGPTDVRVPLTGSPLRDAAIGCGTLTGDQRGAPAPVGGGCDIGAAELGADLVVTLTPSRASVAAGGDLTYVARVRNAGLDSAPGTVLSVAPPAGTELVLADVSQGTCTGAVTCDVGTLASGQSAIATVVVRAPGSGPLVASAAASAQHPDPDAANSSAAATTAVTPAAGGGGTAPGGTGGADTTPPVLGALRLSGTLRRGRAATIRTTLSEAATVSIRVERLVPGRRVGAACRTGRRRSGLRCTIARLVGTVRLPAKAGSAALRLPAKVARRALTPGRHRLTATAIDAAGNRSAARRLTVTVRR